MLRELCLHGPELLFHILIRSNNKQVMDLASTDFETSPAAVEGA